MRQQSGSNPLCVSLRGDRILLGNQHIEVEGKQNLKLNLKLTIQLLTNKYRVHINQRLLLIYRQ